MLESRVSSSIRPTRHRGGAAIAPPMLYRLARPALFAFDAERAHGLALAALRIPPPPPPPFVLPASRSRWRPCYARSPGSPSPIRSAWLRGFDKDDAVPDALLGSRCFGFAEVGSITPRPQADNPRAATVPPRRGHARRINRMGFNNGGARRRARCWQGASGAGIVGINVGADKDSADRIADYAQMAQVMAPLAADVPHESTFRSPNTPGLRALQDVGALIALLDAVFNALGSLTRRRSSSRWHPICSRPISTRSSVLPSSSDLSGLIVSTHHDFRPRLAALPPQR